MLTLLRRIFGPPAPPPPRLVTLVNRVDDLDARLDYLESELRALRGRVTGAERKKAREDQPGSTIEQPPVSQDPPQLVEPYMGPAARVGRRNY